jgi:preprotein translocase subunit Sec63
MRHLSKSASPLALLFSAPLPIETLLIFHNRYLEMANYYADLGLTPSATHEEVKAAFYRLAKQHHPDKQGPDGGGDASEFRKVRKAYEKLCERAAKTSSELPKSKNETGLKKYDTYYHSRLKPPQ